MQQAVEDSRGQDCIVVKYLGPLLEGPVSGNNHGAPLIAMADHLEEQIGAALINGQIAKLVKLC